jgi:nuclear factor NF-kappa-B p105 subunit
MTSPPGSSQNEKLAVASNVEDIESGYVEERMDSGLPSSIPATESMAQSDQDKTANTEADQALEALKDKQQMAFEVCDRMFNALLAWATTKDIRYLLAAQRSLTAVQNQEGDTALHLAIIHNHQDVVLQLLDVLPQLPPTETPVVDCLNNFKQV